jgi:predicted cobalt transporter CbtA
VLAIIPLLVFVVAFIVRGVTAGFEFKDYVLWMLAGFAVMTIAPAVAFVQTRRQPASTG